MKAATKLATRAREGRSESHPADRHPQGRRRPRQPQRQAGHEEAGNRRGRGHATVATGAVVLPKLASKPKPVKRLKPGTLGYQKAQRQIALLRKKIKAGIATPADIGNGANLALQMGDSGTATLPRQPQRQDPPGARQKVA